MDEQLVQDYLKITGGVIPHEYIDPEHQGQKIVKFSLYEATELDYSNVTNLMTPFLRTNI